MFKDIDIDLLRCFQEVALNQSFTQAADKLSLTQAAVSQKIKRLEDLCGRQLLIRSSRSLKLTREGELLMPYAQKMGVLHQQMQTWLQGPVVAGRLNIGIAEHTAQLHLARMLSAFQRVFPQVDIFADIGLSDSLLRQMHKGHLDLVVAQPSPDVPYEVVLSSENMVWVAGLGYYDEDTRPLPLALLPMPCVYRQAGLAELERIGKPYQISITCTSLAGLQALVAGNLAVSVLTKASLTPELQIVDSKLGLPRLPTIDTCLYRSPTSQSAATEPFVQFLLEQLAE